MATITIEQPTNRIPGRLACSAQKVTDQRETPDRGMRRSQRPATAAFLGQSRQELCLEGPTVAKRWQISLPDAANSSFAILCSVRVGVKGVWVVPLLIT
jgi:hypothetical protein